jgi:structural maintenance of chromosome 2
MFGQLLSTSLEVHCYAKVCVSTAPLAWRQEDHLFFIQLTPIFFHPDKEIAKLVTFDKNVRVRSVTIDGDVYDPAGTLTGGSKSQSGSILVRLQEYVSIEKQLVKEKAELAILEKELLSFATKNNEHQRLSQQLELKEHQKSLLADQIRQSPASQVQF